MSRKQRIDSITAQVEVMQKAVQGVEAPAHIPLTDDDRPFWQNIIAEKPKAEWTAHDLEIAAMLAQSLRKLRDEEKTLDTEGAVYTNGAGNMIQNPRFRVVKDLVAIVRQYRQTLGIHNRAKEGEARDVRKRREQAFEVENNNPLGDDLIARPMH